MAGSGGGNGFGYSGDGGPATSALLNGPTGVFADSSGNFFIADQLNNVIREVNTAGTITTVAGNTSGTAGFSGDGEPAVGAELFFPENVWGDSSGNYFVSDFSNNVIRKFTVGGNIQTVPETASPAFRVTEARPPALNWMGPMGSLWSPPEAC